MQVRFDYLRMLSLCVVCLVGLACSSSSSGNEGEFCGGFAGARCGANEYCDYPDNDCGIADSAGTCKPRPPVCTAIYKPVCACDGEVYGNECDAAAHGVDVSASGDCG